LRRYLFLKVDDAAGGKPSSETNNLTRAFPNLKIHVEWRTPFPPFPYTANNTSSNRLRTLHIHAPLNARALHLVLLSMLRKPQPRSGRSYVDMEADNDIDSVMLHPLGHLSGSTSSFPDRRYRIKSANALTILLEDGDWSRQRALDGLKNILFMLTRDNPSPPQPGNAGRGEVETGMKTVDLHFPDMHPRYMFSWLQFVSEQAVADSPS
jgi:hypothetical protein